MADKIQKTSENVAAQAPEDDDFITVPEGQSRLRYLATIGLVLFLLIIFVVSDVFSTTLTGGGSGPDETYITWKDPLDGAENEVLESDFMQTKGLLARFSSVGIYVPDSLQFGDPTQQRRRSETTDEDVASFLIYEDLAKDAGIAISDVEHIAYLKRSFGDSAGLNQFAANMRMAAPAVEDAIRRVNRVNKLRALMISAVSIPDAEKVVSTWQDQRPEHAFQVVSVTREDFVAQAEGEIPADEALTEWFHARPQIEQERLYTDPRVVAGVAYAPVGADFDATKLLEAYPAPEGLDLDEQAQNYHRLFRVSRFRVPTPEPDGSDDPVPPTEKAFFEFEEVEEQARLEAPIHSAMSSFLTDLQDRVNAGEEIDLAAEAEALGLTFAKSADEGATRDELAEAEIWGDQSLAGRLIFGTAGRFAGNVVVTDAAMTIGQTISKIDRVEPPFPEIRDRVATQWADQRAGELAVEALENVRLTLASKPDDVEAADWRPEIDKKALSELAFEANYTYYERPYLERFDVPGGNNATATPADQHVRQTATLFEMEAGQVAPAAASRDGATAFLVRYEGERKKSPKDIDAQTVLSMRRQALTTDVRDFGSKLFLGDSAWLVEKTGLSFPVRDRREAERDKSNETADSDS